MFGFFCGGYIVDWISWVYVDGNMCGNRGLWCCFCKYDGVFVEKFFVLIVFGLLLIGCSDSMDVIVSVDGCC